MSAGPRPSTISVTAASSYPSECYQWLHCSWRRGGGGKGFVVCVCLCAKITV